MWLLLFFTVLGILIKIWAARRYWQARDTALSSIALIVFAMAFAQSLLELVHYYHLQVDTGHDMTMIIKLYHACIVAFLIPMCLLTVGVIRGALPPYSFTMVTTGALAIALWILTTNNAIVGAEALPQAYTRIPGPYYWVFQVAALTAIVAGLVIPMVMYLSAKRELHRVKAAWISAGMVGIFVVGVTIIALMAAGVPITGAGIGPLVMSLYLAVVAECLRDGYVFDIRRLMPWTAQGRELIEVNKPLLWVRGDPINAKDQGKQFVDLLVDTAVKTHETQKAAADSLKISPAKMSRDYKKIRNSNENN